MAKQWIIFCAWMACFPLFAASLPNAFQARYELEKFGTVIAEMQLSLTQQSNHIIYQSNVDAKGILAMISNDTINERSLLEINNKRVQLINYDYNREKRPKDTQHYQLKNANDGNIMISGLYAKQNILLYHSAPVWDKQSVQLALMSDVSADTDLNTTYTYNIIDNGKIKYYQFEYIANETLRIGKKRYQTLKIKRQHDKNNKRVSYFWLATELSNLPVKIEQYKQGKLNLSMQLKKFKWLQND